MLIVDHHGPPAGERRSSLRQVFELLGLPESRWDRWYVLVDANDRGHLSALARVGAGREEMRRVRDADRRAQGISPAEDAAAEEAVADAETYADGALTVVRLPHGATAAAADLLAPELGGSGYENLLVICPDEVDFFGSGELIASLDREFPGGWCGGELPRRGFWGHRGHPPGLLDHLLRRLGAGAEQRKRVLPVG